MLLKTKENVEASESNSDRITRLEVIIENINLMFSTMEKNRMDEMKLLNEKIKEISSVNDEKLNRFEKVAERIENRIWQLIFFVIGSSASILGVVAKGFHWL